MPKEKPKRKQKEKKVKISFFPELCHREFADSFDINFKKSGLFAISFITVNPRQTNEGSVHSVIYMESKNVEALADMLDKALSEYRKTSPGKKKG
jgi:hypothetical protein